MKIVLYAHNLKTGGGISVGKNLILSLANLSPDYKFLIVIPSIKDYENIFHGFDNIEVIHYSHFGFIKRFIFEYISLPKLVKLFNPNLCICLGNIALKRIAAPQILLLHNPYYVYPIRKFLKFFSMKLLLTVVLQRFIFYTDLRRIELLFCQTNSMMVRVKKMYSYTGDIMLLPNALSNDLKSYQVQNRPFCYPGSLINYKNKKILFCLTAYYPHKNIESAIDLFLRHKHPLEDYVLVITLDPTSDTNALRLLNRIKDQNLDNKIINIGPVSQNDLNIYYHYSYALFLPTLLESFSGTYLEAMKYEVPIITSDMDFSREICGDAACYFDPFDVDSMLHAIQYLDKSREKLIINGRKKLASFSGSWNKLATHLLTQARIISNNSSL